MSSSLCTQGFETINHTWSCTIYSRALGCAPPSRSPRITGNARSRVRSPEAVVRALRWCNSLQNPRETLSRRCDCIPASSGTCGDGGAFGEPRCLSDGFEGKAPEHHSWIQNPAELQPEHIPADQPEECVEELKSVSAHEWICHVDLSVLEGFHTFKHNNADSSGSLFCERLVQDHLDTSNFNDTNKGEFRKSSHKLFHSSDRTRALHEWTLYARRAHRTSPNPNLLIQSHI